MSVSNGTNEKGDSSFLTETYIGQVVVFDLLEIAYACIF